MPVLRSLVAVLPLMALAACSSGPAVSPDMITQCGNEAGIDGPFSVRSGVVGGVQFAEFQAGPTVTAAQAAIGNQCLQRLVPGAVTEGEARAASETNATSTTRQHRQAQALSRCRRAFR